MAFVDCGSIAIPMADRSLLASFGPFGAALLDATGEKFAWLIRAPKTGNISGFGFRLGAVTTGKTLKGSLQDVTAGAFGEFVPDGTVDQSGTVAVADSDDNTWKNITLGANRSVTIGDPVAVVIEWNNDGDPGNLEISTFTPQGAGSTTSSLPVGMRHRTGGAWNGMSQHHNAILAVKYSDNTYPALNRIYPMTSYVTGEFASGLNSTPDEMGMKFNFPFPCKIKGVWYMGPGGTGGIAIDIVLYDSSSNVLKSFTHPNETGSGAEEIIFRNFDSEVTISKNTDYRLVFKPTDTNSSSNRGRFMTVNDPAMREHMEWGAYLMKTERTNANATWTDTNTVYPMGFGLILSALDDGVSTGGGFKGIIGG